MGIPGEVVAITVSSPSELKIVSADQHETLVSAVVRQQFLTKTEKIQMGQYVVFQYNAFFNRFKKPANAAADGYSASYIRIEKTGMNFAIPVNLADNLSGTCLFFGIACNVRSGTIGTDK